MNSANMALAMAPGLSQVRDAVIADVPLMAALEMEVSHIRRDGDYRHFIENPMGIWHVSVFEGEDGQLDGFLVSCAHPGCNMLGPGVMRNDDEVATAMLTLIDGALGYIGTVSAQAPLGTVAHHHGEADHRAFLERPHREAIAAIEQRRRSARGRSAG